MSSNPESFKQFWLSLEPVSFVLPFELLQFADGEEKTEEPTAKRLSDAREKGNIPKSQDLTIAVSLLIETVVAYFLVYHMYKATEELFKLVLNRFFIPELSQQDLWLLLLEVLWSLIYILWPLFLAAILITIAVNQFQIGSFHFSLQPLIPDITRFNMIAGLKRMFGKEAVVELIKSMIKLVVLSYFPYKLFVDEYPKICQMYEFTLGYSLDYIAWLILKLILQICIILIIYGILDFMYSLYKQQQDLRMTKQEVKDERKQSEGDPLIKGAIRRKQRELAQKQMMGQVPKADVVITNPTHFAIALSYAPGKDKAPVVIAKGQDLIALKIREIASEHKIPIIEDKPLARILYKEVGLDQTIPEKLFQAVATILAQAFKMKKKSAAV